MKSNDVNSFCFEWFKCWIYSTIHSTTLHFIYHITFSIFILLHNLYEFFNLITMIYLWRFCVILLKKFRDSISSMRTFFWNFLIWNWVIFDSILSSYHLIILSSYYLVILLNMIIMLKISSVKLLIDCFLYDLTKCMNK
jgi:hypothetical protein